MRKGELLLITSGKEWDGQREIMHFYIDIGEWPDLQSVVKETASGFKSWLLKNLFTFWCKNFQTFQENLIHPRPYSPYPVYVLFTALYLLFDSLFVIAVHVVQGPWIEVLYNSLIAIDSYTCQAYSCWVLISTLYWIRVQVSSLENKNDCECFKNIFNFQPFLFLSQRQWLIS